MLRSPRNLAAAILLALAAVAAPSHAEPGRYTLANGTYRAVTPPGWDGRSKLPLLLYMHGYNQTSDEVVGDADLVGAATGAGVLLVVPDGVGKTWSHVGSPSHARDDLAFLHAVVDDAGKRFPVDRSRVLAAGFSQGGSMVWDLACHASQGFAAFLPVSGDFWLPYPERCESGPVNLRHVHGMNDPTFPMTGRPLRSGRFTQGDLGKSFAVLQQTDRCGTEADRIERQGEVECWIWSSCRSGKRLELCLHGDGHWMKGQWLSEGIAWAFTLPAAPGG